VYGASKAALQILSVAAAKELGPKGIRVNSVAPALIPTDMPRGAFQAGYDQLEAQAKQMTPLEHRVGTVEEVANVVAFLAGPEASWVTAQTIDLAGGL
jgi:3-oxoacyl-[acyl-carrier protein] reductase